MAEPVVFIEPPGGKFAIGCAAIFIVPITFGIAVQIWNAGPIVVALPIVAGILLLAIVFFFFSVEARVTIDEREMRFSQQRVLFGVRMREQVAWRIPIEKLTHAREVTTRTPSSKGGWNTSTRLQLPEGRVLDTALLGGNDVPDTAYGKLARWLKERLGDRFTRETVT